MPKFKHDNNKIEDTKLYTQKTEKIAHDSAVDLASTISNFGQTYIVFKHENVLSPSNHSVEIRTGTAHSAAERGVFFRFGSWCYSGRVDLGIEHEGLTLDKVHTIVPNLAKQQENMVFCTELKTLCKSSKTYQSLLRLEIAAAYVIEQMPHLISEMERLHKLLTSQGQRPWIDDDNVSIYFELQLTDKGALPLEEVEAACGRLFIKGILLTIVYIANNIYIILDERDGDHALLDSTIPDISIKARGYTLGSKPNALFKKLSVWESVPTMEKAPKNSKKIHERNNETNASLSMRTEGKNSDEYCRGKSMQNLGSDKLGETGQTRPPHRLAPIAGKDGKKHRFEGLKPLGKILPESPWDALGKPKNRLLPSKK